MENPDGSGWRDNWMVVRAQHLPRDPLRPGSA